MLNLRDVRHHRHTSFLGRTVAPDRRTVLPSHSDIAHRETLTPRKTTRRFAIDYAYGAIEEAEYAVLDATLARMDADALAAG